MRCVRCLWYDTAMTNTRAVLRGAWYGLLFAGSVALPSVCLLLMLVTILYVGGALLVFLLFTLLLLFIAGILVVSWFVLFKESMFNR